MAIVINGSGTVTGLAVGGLPDGTVDAGTLASNAVTEAKIATDSVTAAKIPDTVEAGFKSGRKNMVINGAMQVAQRGTSFSAGSSGIYTLDRFKAENDAASMTVSQDTDSPVGFSSSLKCLNGSGTASSGSDSCYIRQYFEGYNTSHLEIGTANAKEVTLSFWVKSSITGTYIVSFLNAGQDDGYATSYTISSANTWEYKTVTLTFSDYASWSGSTTNSSNFILHFDLGSGPDRDFTSLNVWNDNVNNKWTHSSQVDWVATTGATFYLTGVQLELGSTATDFEHRSYGEELALCQRYFVKFPNGAGYFAGNAVGSNRVDTGFPLSVPLRTAPSVESNGYLTHRSGNANSSANAITLDPYNGLSSTLKLRCGGHSVTDEVAYAIVVSSADLNLDAEL